MSKIIKAVIKGIILWFTAISCIVLIMGVESLLEQEKYMVTIIWGLGNIFLINLCSKEISIREFYVLSGTYWCRKWLKGH